MSLKDFLHRLLPNFERSRIIEDLETQRADCSEFLHDVLNGAVGSFRGKKFNSEFARGMELMFHRRFPEERGETHLSFSKRINDNIVKVLDDMPKLVQETFSRDVTKEAMTYKKAAIIQYLSLVNFFVDYTAKHLTVLLGAEAARVNGNEKAFWETVLPVDKRFLVDNTETYLQAMKVLGISPTEFYGKLEKMEDLQIIADKIKNVESTLGVEAIDPLRVGMIGIHATCSPVYKIRAMWASYQVARHQRNKELIKTLQLRLLALKDSYANKQDPRLQEQIEVSTARLENLNQSVAEFEAQYGK